jgi:hypothetical protein
MPIIGKLHELSFYGLLSAIISLLTKITSFEEMKKCAFHVHSFRDFFLAYLFWASILFIPIAIIGAFSTKYGDYGEGLHFQSDNIIVIVFAHIAEEILGLFLSPFWFLRDIFSKGLTVSKTVDYISYFIEIVFLIFGFYSLMQ